MSDAVLDEGCIVGFGSYVSPIFSLFDLPNEWRSSSSYSRSTRQVQHTRLDPTHAADSVFLLELYNELNEHKQFDLSYHSSKVDC